MAVIPCSLISIHGSCNGEGLTKEPIAPNPWHKNIGCLVLVLVVEETPLAESVLVYFDHPLSSVFFGIRLVVNRIVRNIVPLYIR